MYGVIGGCAVKLRQDANGIEVHGVAGVSEDTVRREVERYFRLDQDIEPVHAALSDGDSDMERLVERYGHIRVLRQYPWECLLAYACSRNNSVTRITAILEQLAGEYHADDYLDGELDGVQLYALPSCEGIFAGRETKLNELEPKLGLGRERLIWTLAIDVAEDFLSLSGLTLRKYEQARRMLMSYDGVGPKIADCVCLFSLDKPQAFPVDVNIRRALYDLYGDEARGRNDEQLAAWARDRFGSNAGYAGQLLFQHERHK